MKMKGTDGLMLARNRVRRLLREHGNPDSLACELTRQITCCEEGLSVHELFMPDEAQQLSSHCDLYCAIEDERPIA